MTGRNLRILSIIILVSVACAVQASRLRNVSDIALAMDYIEQMYVDPVLPEQLSEHAMVGMMERLDPYSSFMPPKDFESFHSQIEQNFAGLGIVVSKTDDGWLKIVRTIHGAPAEKAGLTVDDLILEIAGTQTKSLKIEEASALLRGKPKTSVELQLGHIGDQGKRMVSVTRDIIETPSVIGDRRGDNGETIYQMQADPRIAYIHLAIFGEQSTNEMRKFLLQNDKQSKAVIVDLRENAGGLLTTAHDICDMFLNDGLIVSTRGRVPMANSELFATPGTLLGAEKPLVILLDGGSASASEVTAACLRDRKRAAIAGERSYGKGSVQNVIDMDGGRAALRLTTAYWFPPSGEKIHRSADAKPEDQWGVDPDPALAQKLTVEQKALAFSRLFRRDQGDLTPHKAEAEIDAIEDVEVPEPASELEQQILTADPSLADDPQLLKVVAWLNAERLK